MAQLKYSEFSNTIYFTDGKKKIAIDENNFIQMILLWMYKDIPEEAKEKLKHVTQEITVDGKPHYELTLKKVI
jgi:hypothetical protein